MKCFKHIYIFNCNLFYSINMKALTSVVNSVGKSEIFAHSLCLQIIFFFSPLLVFSQSNTFLFLETLSLKTLFMAEMKTACFLPKDSFWKFCSWNRLKYCYHMHMQSWGHYFMFSHWRKKESFSYHYSTFKVMKRNEKQQMHWSETVNLMCSYQKAAFMRLPLCWDMLPNGTT